MVTLHKRKRQERDTDHSSMGWLKQQTVNRYKESNHSLFAMVGRKFTIPRSISNLGSWRAVFEH